MLRLLFQQVAPVVALLHGSATTVVRNTAPVPQTVTVEVRSTGADRITPRDTVPALISPRSFTLPPGEIQTVRLRLSIVPPDCTVLRLVSCWTPVEVRST